MTNFLKSTNLRVLAREWIKSIKTREMARQKNTINLIPSENIAFPEVQEAIGSNLSNKYSEGYPGKRYYAGNKIIDEVENTAINLAKGVFNVPFVNVQPYSGSIANRVVYETVMNEGDSFMGMDLFSGGHLTHGYKMGKRWNWVPYHLNPETGLLDMDEIQKLTMEHKPKLIWCGATAYSRTIPFKQFGEIAEECGAYLAADISHIAGLIAGGAHRSPHSYTDIITTTTHKTLRGPRAAMIMVTEKGLEKDPRLGQKINTSVFPNMQGGPHNEKIFGMAVMLHCVSEPFFKNYAHQVVKNAATLSSYIQDTTSSEKNIKVVSGGTSNHLMVLDLTDFGEGRGIFAQLALESIGIICNKNTVPGDKGSPFYPSGIRIGTPTLTSRGADEEDMKILASIISSVIHKTMSIVNSYEGMKKFPGETKEYRSQALKNFKELLKFHNEFMWEEKADVKIFLSDLDR